MNAQEIINLKLKDYRLVNNFLLNKNLQGISIKDDCFDNLNNYSIKQIIYFLKTEKPYLFQTNYNKKTLIGSILEKISILFYSSSEEELKELIDFLGPQAITKEFCYPTTNFSISCLTSRVNLFKYLFQKIKISYEIYETPGYISFFKKNSELFGMIRKLMNYDPYIMTFFKNYMGENTMLWKIFFSSYIMNALYCQSKILTLQEINESIKLINKNDFIFLPNLIYKELKHNQEHQRINLIHLNSKESTNLILLLLNKNIIKLEMLNDVNIYCESFFEKVFFKKLYIWENVVQHDVAKTDDNFENFIEIIDEMKIFIDSGVKPLFIKKNKKEVNVTLDQILLNLKIQNNDCLLLKSKKIKNKLNVFLDEVDFLC